MNGFIISSIRAPDSNYYSLRLNLSIIDSDIEIFKENSSIPFFPSTFPINNHLYEIIVAEPAKYSIKLN